MSLWERELDSYRPKLGELSPPQRLKLAVTALDQAFKTEPAPYDEPDPARWLEEVIRIGWEDVGKGAEKITLPSGLRDEFGEIDEGVSEPGVGQLLMAAIVCVDTDSLNAWPLAGVLYSCYEFTMQRQVPEPLSIQEEEANERCLEVVAYHKELITQATAGA